MTTASDARWWYRTPGGDLYGPYDVTQLREYALDGRIDAAGSIREGDAGDWLDPREVLPRLGIELFDDSVGAASVPPVERTPPRADAAGPSADLSQTAYILLGLLPFLLVSISGIHNLTAGRVAAGVTQLLLSLIGVWGFGCVGALTGGAGLCLSVPIWVALLVWTIIDVSTVRTDGSGRVFRT